MDGDSRMPRDAGQQKIEKFRRFIQRLGRHNPIRAIALDLLEHSSGANGNFESLLASLNNSPEHRWRERIVTAWAIGEIEMTPDQGLRATRALSEILENRQIGTVERLSIRGLQVAKWFFGPLMVTLSLWYLLCVCLLNLIGPGFDGPIAFVCGVILFTVGLYTLCSPIISLRVHIVRNNYVRAMAAISLGRRGMVDGIWALADAYHDSTTHLGRTVFTSLQRVLPALRADDYGRLDAQTVPNLCRLLRTVACNPSHEPFSSTVLDALGKIGDGRAVAPVEFVAKHSRIDSLRAAAEQVLPLLRERQRLEQDAERLLRPSDNPDAPTEVLLRPIGPTETLEELLLRPSDREA